MDGSINNSYYNKCWLGLTYKAFKNVEIVGIVNHIKKIILSN